MVAIYNWFGSYIDWHHYLIDCDQIGSCINGCTSSNQLQSTRIIDVDDWFDVRFDGRFDVWFDGQFDVQFDGRFNGRFDGQFDVQFDG
jgi:hypothetical protein